MNKLTISVIILNYNDYTTTIKLLESIRKYELIDSIVVVDNCSTNNSFDMLSRFASEKCHIIKTNYNGGYAFGNNEGIKYSVRIFNPDIIAIVNPDVFFEEKVLASIKEIFKKQDYALLSPVMYDISGKVSSKPYWSLPTYKNDLFMCFYLYRKIKTKQRNQIDYSSPVMDVEVLPGSFLAFRSNVLREINYFDQTLFLYCEERMICWKLKQANYKVGLITGDRYEHMHAVTTRKYLKDLKINSLMSDARYYYEHKYNKICLPQRMLLKLCMAYSKVEFMLISLTKQIAQFFKNK